MIKMTPAVLLIGAPLVFWAATVIVVIIPIATMDVGPSKIWRPWTPEERAGHKLYVENGCSYCHSRYIRVNDWGLGAERIAEPGDYSQEVPAILGTERTGPDLSQEGGEHTDGWHTAHFTNPRYTRPLSLMPAWAFLGRRNIERLTAYVQAQGGTMADERVARQQLWNIQAAAAHRRGGEDGSIEWLHANIPAVWRPMPNPYPATPPALGRGQKIYQDFCLGCHGPMGDGTGPAAQYLDPPPLNFTTLRRHLVEGRYIGGIFYYQIMNGVTGTAMPYFKRELASEKIWDVSNYVALRFLGYTDADTEPFGIDAAYEPVWANPYKPPVVPGKPGPEETPGKERQWE